MVCFCDLAIIDLEIFGLWEGLVYDEFYAES